MIDRLAHSLGRHDLAVRAAKQATRDGYISNARIFPLVDLPFAYANGKLEHALVLALTLHSSLQHEALHGHPFRNRILNEALVFPALSLCIPYIRFRDTHLAHHQDAILTDPYDDPESNYLDASVWERLSPWTQAVLNLNNRLLGRLLIGPIVSQMAFMTADWRAIRAGDRAVLRGWLWHIPALALVIWCFCRFYYFAFYVIERYVDPGYKFSGLGSFGDRPMPYSDNWRRARVGAKSKTKHAGFNTSSSFGLSPFGFLIDHGD